MKRNLTLALEAEASCRLSLNSSEGTAQSYLWSFDKLRMEFAGTGGAFLLERAARMIWMAYRKDRPFPLDA